MELSKDTIMRAWKDESFRESLSPEERAAIPGRPTAADGSALSDEQLEAAAGGTTPGCIVVGGVAGGYIISEIVD
jgi:mersacidin/lichenicidin family type 2 lantibiotic